MPAASGAADRAEAAQIRALSERVAAGIRRETDRARAEAPVWLADRGWALPVRMPPGVDPRRAADAVLAEHLPCHGVDERGAVLLPLWAGCSSEDQDHLVLVVAKVVHHLTPFPVT
ncbi:MAG: hypothetical protein U0821_20225 [Chloroflexota bacterium]